MGSDNCKKVPQYAIAISIHAPRVGSDVALPVKTAELCRFQSTLPVWGATAYAKEQVYNIVISIHAPRVGSDNEYKAHIFRGRTFQSTLPVWGATWSLN